jgi:hypothetical protein
MIAGFFRLKDRPSRRPALGPEEKGKPVPGPAGGGKQTGVDQKESKEEKKAKKEELDSKGKSTETKEEKIERKQKTLD